ncbi:hypothetical protein [Flavihumibacter sp. UBA7668]|uniref:hypothetical protein n=1 Tax=Flavihumibacter sp. UBA7668 TaxID=1946542 RepID=UPI0025C38B12|nr:hypothetical protein [Flavihumibacter sp. UBA7668]
MIRKYFSGLLAAFLAITMVAFTPSEKEPERQTTSTFYYVPPEEGDYSLQSVETESNWKIAPLEMPTCDGDNKACSIEVDNDDTNGSGSLRTLAFELEAIPGSGSIADHVPDVINTTEILSKVDKD